MFVDTKETSFLFDLTKPSAKALSHILRHKELWPVGFVWNYGDCSSCALGLAYQLWKGIIKGPNTRYVASALNLDEDKARNNVFINYKLFNETRIMPEMVADKLDDLIGA